MCLVLGLYFSSFAIFNAPELSSNTLHLAVDFDEDTANPNSLSSFSRFIRGMASLIASDSPMYSTSVELNAINCMSLDAWKMTIPMYLMMKLYLDLVVSISLSG